MERKRENTQTREWDETIPTPGTYLYNADRIMCDGTMGDGG